MKLPKMYRPIKIKFWSLRFSAGIGRYEIYDNDELVERVCRRVKTCEGWKWQIVNSEELSMWEPYIEVDKEILDEYGSKLEYWLVVE